MTIWALSFSVPVFSSQSFHPSIYHFNPENKMNEKLGAFPYFEWRLQLNLSEGFPISGSCGELLYTTSKNILIYNKKWFVVHFQHGGYHQFIKFIKTELYIRKIKSRKGTKA